MSKENQDFIYVSIESQSVGGIEVIKSIELSSTRSSLFGSQDEEGPDDKGEAGVDVVESDHDDRAAPETEDFTSLSRGFFDAMLGFADVLRTAGASYDVMQTVLMRTFVERSVEPICIEKRDTEGRQEFKLSSAAFSKIGREFEKARRQINHVGLLNNVFLLGLVSQFDHYVGSLIRQASLHKPHIISDSERTYKPHEILAFSSMEAFQESVLGKEVETILRMSHEEQFKWIERKLEVKLRAGLDVWPEFMEICERRNIFAHNNGIVSETYRKKCKDAGLGDVPDLGVQLRANSAYLSRAVVVLLEIGIKLSQVIRRKILEDANSDEVADLDANRFAYELINHGYYDLAVKILEFSFLPVMRHPKRACVLMMRVNLANAHKLNGDMESAEKVLKEEDWSPLQLHFQICVAAVRNDIDEVLRLIPFVSTDEIEAPNYFQWPVFRGIVDDARYIDAIKEQFGDEVVALFSEQVIEVEENGPEIA